MTHDRISVLIVDDHPLLRAGVAQMIAGADDMVVVGEAGDGLEAIEMHRVLQPDVTLMDIGMPRLGGLDAMIEIRKETPRARFVVLTVLGGDEHARRAARAGADAYLLKSNAHGNLLDYVRAVHRGLTRFDPVLTHAASEPGSRNVLTALELQVVGLMASGSSNREICERLGLTAVTVKGQVRSVLEKLGARSRTQAVTEALRRGIIDH